MPAILDNQPVNLPPVTRESLAELAATQVIVSRRPLAAHTESDDVRIRRAAGITAGLVLHHAKTVEETFRRRNGVAEAATDAEINQMASMIAAEIVNATKRQLLADVQAADSLET